MPPTSGKASRALLRITSGVSGLGAMLGMLSTGMVIGSFVLPDDSPAPRYESLDPSSPVRLVIPALDVRAPVVPVAVDDQDVLDPPRDPTFVGWWEASAEPGTPSGQTVITGHTVHTGGGAMDEVDTLQRGQRVDVVTRKGTMRYEVTQVQVLDKDEVARQAVSLFGQGDGTGRLVLVSCDQWNGRFYESNVVVFGAPLGQPIRNRKADTGADLEAAPRTTG